VAPLREHAEDIPLLTQHFIKRDKLDISLDNEAVKALLEHNWPGNVRELRNVINRLGLFRTGEIASAEDVRTHIGDLSLYEHKILMAVSEQNELERARLVDALDSTGHDILATAEKLGVSRATVYNMMNRHGIKRKRSK
jgi:DNA-binding NtrC family response regulator